MSNGHGGYRRPANPAPVSPPGALSRRTDGGPAQIQSVPDGLPYGERKALQMQEQVAPMAGTPSVPLPPKSGYGQIDQSPGAAAGPPVPMVTGIGAPTTRPNEHIMTGTDYGPGPGSEILPMQHTTQFTQQGPMTQLLSRLSASDTSGVLGTILATAKGMGA